MLQQLGVLGLLGGQGVGGGGFIIIIGFGFGPGVGGGTSIGPGNMDIGGQSFNH